MKHFGRPCASAARLPWAIAGTSRQQPRRWHRGATAASDVAGPASGSPGTWARSPPSAS